MNMLVNLGKKITDYDAQDDDEEMGDEGGDGADIDERQGVAVDFGEDDEDEEEEESPVVTPAQANLIKSHLLHLKDPRSRH